MTETISDISLYLTIMANGPNGWTPEQLRASYEYAKTLMPAAPGAQVLSIAPRNPPTGLQTH